MNIQEYRKRCKDGQIIEFVDDFLKDYSGDLELFTAKAGDVLIHTGDPCSYVYILLEGKLETIEEQISGVEYHFFELNAIDVLGDFELFAKEKESIIKVTALTNCVYVRMPAILYMKWITRDAHALSMRLQLLMQLFIRQSMHSRKQVFISNEQKLKEIIRHYYESQKKEICKLKYTRTQLADLMGCSVRTVNRMVAALEEKGDLSLLHGKIVIDKNQYKHLQNGAI